MDSYRRWFQQVRLVFADFVVLAGSPFGLDAESIHTLEPSVPITAGEGRSCSAAQAGEQTVRTALISVDPTRAGRGACRRRSRRWMPPSLGPVRPVPLDRSLTAVRLFRSLLT
ncbi:MAG: hypothetical protein OXC19_11095 [Bryobacterales bacterium]|nr:hypothetical protein [Bryobacterales bacterium]